jgi:hypothetical protein
VWLENSCYYVSLDGDYLVLYDLFLGTTQGSIFWPVLYAIFVFPLFDIVPTLAFADDSYKVNSGSNKTDFVKNMEKLL